MSNRDALDSFLQSLIPHSSRQDAVEISCILDGIIDGSISKQEAINRLSQPKLADSIANLAGKSVKHGGSIVDFGSEGQFGDVTIRDIVGGSVIKLNVPINLNQNSQNFSIGQQTNVYYISTNGQDLSLKTPDQLITNKKERVEIVIHTGNVQEIRADILVLKFAETFHGADYQISAKLGLTEQGLTQKIPELWDHTLLPSHPIIASSYILFLQVGSLWTFQYEQIRRFASDSLRILTKIAPGVKHIAMTIHGTGYGLDEYEAFRSQIAGFFDAFRNKLYPSQLERITIVEINPDRANRLRTILSLATPENINTEIQLLDNAQRIWFSSDIKSAGNHSTMKPLVFVTFNPDNDFDDVYYYGIQDPVSALGYICERSPSYTSKEDVNHVKDRINQASIVIADLSTTDLRLYFEIGYALGREKRLLLIQKESSTKHENIIGVNPITYKKIRDLEEKLSKEIKLLSM
jgi:hypothetical protein